jgi:hypothetical protein
MAKPIPLLAALLVSVALVPAPAMARDHGMGKAVQQLNDPQFQDTIATAMASLSEAMMGMKMAPFAKAMEGMGRAAGDKDAASDIDPDATLGDMMGEDARDMPQQMARQVPQMMGAMAGMAGALEAMLPQFEELGKRLKRQLPRR